MLLRASREYLDKNFYSHCSPVSEVDQAAPTIVCGAVVSTVRP